MNQEQVPKSPLPMDHTFTSSSSHRMTLPLEPAMMPPPYLPALAQHSPCPSPRSSLSSLPDVSTYFFIPATLL